MAAVIGSFGGSLPRRCFLRSRILTAGPPRSAAIRAATTTTPAVETETDPILDAKFSTNMRTLACPICYRPLISTSNPTLASTSSSRNECYSCKKAYLDNEIYLDLTIAGSSQDYAETMPAATELFRTPLVSFLYERGWRQNFVWGGFPGPDREFEMAKDFLKDTIGGTIVDASCGSGLFSRLFAKSGTYSRVVALDFSENMLRQCYEFIKQENIPKENLILIRADISRLPFVSSSIDAVHAGAALHCWPSPSSAFEMAKDFLKDTIGGTIVDASCGSGLFSRLFAKSGTYSRVVALDFSENMLRQCYEFIKQENIPKENLILIRADISRLPFVSSSIDAVHAGAALHCWPSPSSAVAEISRVLRPGGVFVATTFILDVFYPAVPILRSIREVFTRASSNHLYLSEVELEDLCTACGLVGFTCLRNGPFVMISATKRG